MVYYGTVVPFLHNVLMWYQLWHRGVVVITTAQLHSTKSELRLCAGSNPARDALGICNDENL